MQSPDSEKVPSVQSLPCFAYQTPPYKECVTDESSPSKGSPRNNAFNELLVDRLAILMTRYTARYGSGKTKGGVRSIRNFLKELLRRSQCNRRAALLATAYFEKIYRQAVKLPEFARSVRRIYLCCLILSHKFLHDKTFSLNAWRLISGLTPKDLSQMERWCLGCLDYQLYMKGSELRALESMLLQLPTFK